jgi:alkylhydroperoxidase family enzyme
VLTEEMVAKIAAFESSDLADHHKAALRYADAIMTQPGQIGPALRADLHRHFTREQIIEITMDVLKWNLQKVTVAMGTDADMVEGELVDLVFDERGNWVR